MNPEGYKKYKAKKNTDDEVVSNTFKQEIMEHSGMTEAQYDKMYNSKGDELDFPEDPFVI